MIWIRSCRSWSQKTFFESSRIISFQRLLSTSIHYPASPKAHREVPTPLVLFCISKWEGHKDGESIYHAFINHFTKEGWNVNCIDLDPDESGKNESDQKNLESSLILSRLESTLVEQIRLAANGSGPFPPLLVSYGFSTLIAEQFVSSHPLSGLALINPPLTPSHAHRDRSDIFPTDLKPFTYEPTFPIVIARSKNEAEKIKHLDMHRIERMQQEEEDDDGDESVERRVWDLSIDSNENVSGPYQLREWANENGISPPSIPEWFTKGKYIRNDKKNKREPLVLDDAHIEESFIRGSGPGGQAINKLSTCVALKHTPTGTVVRCQDTRSRQQNRIGARRKLGLLLEHLVFGKGDSVIGKEETKKRNQKRVAKRKQKKKRAEKAEKKDGIRTTKAAGLKDENMKDNQ